MQVLLSFELIAGRALPQLLATRVLPRHRSRTPFPLAVSGSERGGPLHLLHILPGRSERDRESEQKSECSYLAVEKESKGKRRDRTAADGVDSDRCAESLPTRTVGPDGRLVDSGLQGSPYGARGPGSGELGGVVSIVHSTSRPPFPFLPPSLCPVPFWLPASASLAPFLCILVSD